MSDAESLYELRSRNRDFFRPFEPTLPEQHFTLEGQIAIIDLANQLWEQGSQFTFGIFSKANNELIGRVNLSNIVRGAWQNCTLGYFLDQRLGSKGYMTEAVKLAVQYAFEQAELHRVQAAVMQHNMRSIRVLEKNHFRYEGLSKNYLKINGTWEDHLIYAITTEDCHPDYKYGINRNILP